MQGYGFQYALIEGSPFVFVIATGYNGLANTQVTVNLVFNGLQLLIVNRIGLHLKWYIVGLRVQGRNTALIGHGQVITDKCFLAFPQLFIAQNLVVFQYAADSTALLNGVPQAFALRMGQV